MPQIVSKTLTKLMTSPLVSSNYVILCFRGQSPTSDKLLTNFLASEELSWNLVVVGLGGVQFWDADFMFPVNFVKQNEFDKNYGVLCHFLTNFTRLLFNKSVAIVT